MAEETAKSPISEAVPPKANPLATPATAHTATLKLNPVVRRPVTGGAASLRPGLKLPPKPGLATGLKLPPKPGVAAVAGAPGIKLPTQPGLKPGIKLPTQPGLKPGIKLPTQPGLKPGIKLPTGSVAGKVGEPAPAVASNAAAAEPKAAASVVAAPVADAAAPKPEPPKPLEALKAVTQNLKSITSPIPQQAILRKTGIIADGAMSEAQKQAAKSKTSRISLSDAMGVAPVKSEALPMKTIRIKRPVDIPGATGTTATVKPPVASAADPATPEAADTQAETKISTQAQPSTTFTQRKTLKIARPGGGAVRPSGRFGVKKPTAAASKPTGDAAVAENATAVADIPDLPAVPPAAGVAPAAFHAAGDSVPDVPKGVATLGLIVQFAACVAIAALAWMLFQDTQVLPF